MSTYIHLIILLVLITCLIVALIIFICKNKSFVISEATIEIGKIFKFTIKNDIRNVDKNNDNS